MPSEISIDLKNEELAALADICRTISFADVLPLVDCPREAYQVMRGFFVLQLSLENYLQEQQPKREEPHNEH